ncbi:MAG: hypothetical protein H0U49_04830 [Parachlamydiaceae bacterium]|nr:hypothetical protein [Parachlamydiaceae bacterium]
MDVSRNVAIKSIAAQTNIESFAKQIGSCSGRLYVDATGTLGTQKTSGAVLLPLSMIKDVFKELQGKEPNLKASEITKIEKNLVSASYKKQSTVSRLFVKFQGGPEKPKNVAQQKIAEDSRQTKLEEKFKNSTPVREFLATFEETADLAVKKINSKDKTSSTSIVSEKANVIIKANINLLKSEIKLETAKAKVEAFKKNPKLVGGSIKEIQSSQAELKGLEMKLQRAQVEVRNNTKIVEEKKSDLKESLKNLNQDLENISLKKEGVAETSAIAQINTTLNLFDASGNLQEDTLSFLENGVVNSDKDSTFGKVMKHAENLSQALGFIPRYDANLKKNLEDKENYIKNPPTDKTSEEIKTQLASFDKLIGLTESKIYNNKKVIEHYKSELAEDLSELKDDRMLFDKSFSNKARDKIDRVLDLFDTSGNLTNDDEKIKSTLKRNVSNEKFINDGMQTLQNLVPELCEDQNMLRNPLNNDMVKVYLSTAASVVENANLDEFKNILNVSVSCMSRFEKVLLDFTKVDEGEKSMKNMIGVSKDGHYSVDSQDYSKLSSDQLKTIQERAEILQVALKEIHNDLQAVNDMQLIADKKNNEPFFGLNAFIYDTLDAKMSTVLGQGKHPLGKEEQEPLIGQNQDQITKLLNSIENEKKRRTA